MTSLIGCPFRSCLEDTEVRTDRAFLALPKYVGFFEAFLKHELLQRQICLQIETLLQARLIFSLSADRMVYEAGGDLSSGVISKMVAFTSMPFNNTIDTVRYVYSLYPEAAKLA
jgi:hypothetical protein